MATGVVSIERTACAQNTFDNAYRKTENETKPSYKEKFSQSIRRNCTGDNLTKFCYRRFPCLDWIRNYDVKEDLVADIIAGLTIVIFQVPQGMAYAMLANVPPVYGLYTSFFPVLIYAIMGTSKQSSVGTFAIVSLMTGVIVNRYGSKDDVDTVSLLPNSTNIDDNNDETIEVYSHIQVASAVALLCGFYQLLFGILQIGSLSVLLSEQLVSGFTCASAVHVVTSQIKTLFGVNLKSDDSGLLGLGYVYAEFFSVINTTNLVTLALSGVALVILIIFKEGINNWTKKYSKVPFPIEIVLVVASTIVSSSMDLSENHNMTIVGEIEQGFPKPELPSGSLMLKVAAQTVALSVVGFSSTVSLAKMYANKYNYNIDPNQECLALGTANILGAFFTCVPAAGSISRTSVQDGAGGRTQLVSFINCVGLLSVLFYLGQYLEQLPNCVLSAIIVMSLKGMVLQVKDFWPYWKKSKADGMIWMITFVAVILMDVDLGLGIGVGFALLTLVYRSIRPDVHLKESVEGTELYVSPEKYNTVIAPPDTRVFFFGGAIHFANADYFSRRVIHLVGLENDVSKKTNRKKSRIPKMVDESNFDPSELGSVNAAYEICVEVPTTMREGETRSVDVIKHVIMDCSSVSFIDLPALKAIKETREILEKNGIRFSLAGCSRKALKMLETGEMMNESVFPSIQDAIAYNSISQRSKTVETITE